MTLEYWYLFPISVAIATTAMASGIGGAVFFSPLFILVLELEPSVAIGTALMTELFGFTSGVIAYWRRRLIDFKLGGNLLLFSVPMAIVGSLNSDAIPANVLKIIFAIGIMVIGIQLFRAHRVERRGGHEEGHAAATPDGDTVLIDRAGVEYRYRLCHKWTARTFAAVGGWFLGMISVGLAELEEYHLLVRCRIPAPVAVGTSIFVVVVSVLTASAGHFYNFATQTEGSVLARVLPVLTFTIPGVIVGGQIGPFLQARLDPAHVKIGLAGLFFSVGIFMLATTL